MKTNNLKHSISVNNSKVNCIVNIRLNDQCKNGHQDFAITGAFWEIGKSRNDRNFISSGCCHDEILKYFPELKIFVDLHLCDYSGVQTYVIENGFYFLQNGFDKTKTSDENFKKEFCEYYRILSDQYEILKNSENKNVFGYYIYSLGLLNEWKIQANEGIKQLEKLTGDTFVCDSVKTQFNMSNDEILEVEKLINAGFFASDKVEKRKIEKLENEKNAKIEKLKNAAKNDIKKINTELKIKLALIEAGDDLENVIYYTHSNILKFNWKDYNQKRKCDIELILTKLDYKQLPKDIQIKY